MIDYGVWMKEINDILSIISEDDYPETYAYLSIMLEGDADLDAPLDMVHKLENCDKSEPFPFVVSNLILLLLESEIDNGNADAMNDLGALYYEGRVFEQDFEKAVNYYIMAADHGSRQAQENLGYCYYYGRSVPVDYEKAFHYYALGAFDGHIISLYKIGDMYLNGYYVKKNPIEAFKIYDYCKSLINQDNADYTAGPVFLRLGNCFLNGLGTEPDCKLALMCYQQAENYLLDMVQNGDAMYKKSLRAAIDGQAKAREQIAKTMPDGVWLDGVKD